MATFTQQYTISAASRKYGNAAVTLTLSFDNESNTSTLTVDDNFIIGGQTSGYYSTDAPLANNKKDVNSIKFYSLNALSKLGTNHLYIYKKDELDFNKQTRFVCELTMLAATIKNEIYGWRKTLK